MEHSQSFLMLVRQASLGDQDSTQKLLQATSIKLFSYILQLTLDYSLAKELTKEVQNEIAQSLWRLKKPQHFWPRIYAQALETVKENYLDTRKHKDLFLSDEEEDFFNKQLKTKKVREDAFFRELDTDRLFKAAYQAMKKMSLIQRNIVVLRCFEDMSFYDIAQLLDRSETNTRVLFFRAKQKIKYRLWVQKFRVNRMLLPALGLFGTVTSIAPSTCTPTTVVVERISIQIGFVPWLIGTLTSKTGVFFSGLASFFLIWFAIAHVLFLAVACLLLKPFALVLLVSIIFAD
jgi:RNA polymerase sigma-70 factor (ECF subfamily)